MAEPDQQVRDDPHGGRDAGEAPCHGERAGYGGDEPPDLHEAYVRLQPRYESARDDRADRHGYERGQRAETG